MKVKYHTIWALVIALVVLIYAWVAAYQSLSADLPLVTFLSRVCILLPAGAILGVAANSYTIGRLLRAGQDPRFGMGALAGLFLPVPMLLTYVVILGAVWFGIYESANRGVWLLRWEVLPIYGLAGLTFVTIDLLLFKFIDLRTQKSLPSWLVLMVDGNIALLLILSVSFYTFVIVTGNTFALAGGLIVAVALSLVWALRYAATVHTGRA